MLIIILNQKNLNNYIKKIIIKIAIIIWINWLKHMDYQKNYKI